MKLMDLFSVARVQCGELLKTGLKTYNALFCCVLLCFVSFVHKMSRKDTFVVIQNERKKERGCIRLRELVLFLYSSHLRLFYAILI
jgi:hypothetical protein